MQNTTLLLSVLLWLLPGNTENTGTVKQTLHHSQQNIFTIYLSFDDGPLNGSEHIDSVVLAEKIKVSVFLVGRHVQMSRNMENYVKYYNANPFIDEYNHSFTHAKNLYRKYYADTKTVVDDFLKNETFLHLKYRIARLPGRNMWRIGNRSRNDVKSGAAAADSLARLGFRIIGWDLEWQHNPKTGAPLQTAEQMATAVNEYLINHRTFTNNHLVLLLHDEMFQTNWEESELKKFMDLLRHTPGYRFEHLQSYPAN
ncbi:MAG: polysaccharide deacetylase family protein [Lacibacter sp.]|jgi:peptidoglycan/xylan/chitin deacetylase (PgdA/CDA1 family)